MSNQVDSPENHAPPVGLTWGIKRSFVRYVSFLPDCSVSFRDGAEATNGSFFTFTPAGGTLDPHTGCGALRFKGEVQMSGHGGMMRLQLLDPWVALTPGGATLRIATPGVRDAPGSPTDGIAVATLELPQPVNSGSGVLWQDIRTTLTSEGAALFNDQYPAGQEMDPLFIHLSDAPEA